MKRTHKTQALIAEYIFRCTVTRTCLSWAFSFLHDIMIQIGYTCILRNEYICKMYILSVMNTFHYMHKIIVFEKRYLYLRILRICVYGMYNFTMIMWWWWWWWYDDEFRSWANAEHKTFILFLLAIIICMHSFNKHSHSCLPLYCNGQNAYLVSKLGMYTTRLHLWVIHKL